MNIDIPPTPGYDEFSSFIFLVYLFFLTFPVILIISGWLGLIRNKNELNWKGKVKYLIIPFYAIAKNRKLIKDVRYLMWAFLHTILIIDLVCWGLYFLRIGKLIYKLTAYSISPDEFSFYLNLMTYISSDWSLFRIVPILVIYILFTLSFFIRLPNKQEDKCVGN